MHEDWEAIIGLEIHFQLNTKTKLYARSPNRFGDEPNSNISVTCTGQPGTLPILNKEAVKKAVQFGCAIGGQVQEVSKFDRKSYFYPDCPRNFQITQFEKPIILNGSITTDVDGEEKVFEIDRAHIEDDSGMLKHFSTFAGVDFNRAGAPLVEVVSKPCMHSGKDAAAYARAIKAIVQYINAGNCNMEEGGMRFDANISVRKKGEKGFRNKIEIKNMNSFANMELAVESEIKRQIKLYESDPEAVVEQGTYRFDLERGETVLMRRKEDAADYLYVPEPDLLPLHLSKEYIEKIRAALPELPRERHKRYVETLKLPENTAAQIVVEKEISDYFEKAIEKCDDAKSVANWILVEFGGRLKDKTFTLPNSMILPQHIGALVSLINARKITGKIAKEVADIMVETPGRHPEDIVAENPNFQALTDSNEIEILVDKVLAENPEAIELFKTRPERAQRSLVGQVMKLTQGKADPQLVDELIKKKL